MNDIKTNVQELTSLALRTEEIKSKLDSLVKEMAVKVAKSKQGLSYFISDPCSTEPYNEWVIDSNGIINIKWTRDWGTGPSDDGTTKFDSKFLYDENAFKEFDDKNAAELDKRNQILNDQERQRKLVQYNDLKKSLGIN